MRLIKVALALLLAGLLASCGSGGCDAGASPLTGASACGTTTATTPPDTTVNPTATALVVQLSTNSLANTDVTGVTATATATAGGGQAISGVPVTFVVDNNAIYTATDTKTSASGQVVANVSIGADRSNRIVTVKAVSGSLTASASFVVTGAKLTGTAIPATVAPGAAGNRVDFRLVDANDKAMVGQAITVQAGTATAVNGVTGPNGDYSFVYQAPATAGALNIVASAGGATATQQVQVQSVSTTPIVTTPILSASLSANPSVVSTNSSATNNRTEIRALFVGANNIPIQNVRVRFDLNDDPAPDGTFSTGSNIVYSDQNGIATTAYIPGVRSSPTNGVTIRACYGTADFPTCTSAVLNVTASITVASEALGVTIGSNNVVGITDLTYTRDYVVMVVDAAGVAKSNVAIVPSVDLLTYRKGRYVTPGSWVVQAPGPFECPNEDLNRNGVLEASEDLNKSGSIEPRKSDVAISVVGSATTDSSGKATLRIEYPQNVGSWVVYKILVAATGVSGTEGRATWTELAPVPLAAITSAASPPFVFSPYGTVVVTADDLTDNPDRGPVPPCQNKN